MFIQLIIRIKVKSFLSEFIEETKLADRTFTSQTSETNTVYTTTIFSQGRKLAIDSTNITAGTIEITRARINCRTFSINTFIIHVTIIKQRNILINLNSLTKMLRHIRNISQRHKELFFTSINNSLLQIEESSHLNAIFSINSGRRSIRSIVLKHIA